MRQATIYFKELEAGILTEILPGEKYSFQYFSNYEGEPVSQTMPFPPYEYLFTGFPPFFEGLLPEGFQLEALLMNRKIDRNDLFSQLIATGNDMVGAVTIREIQGNE